ncbi:hypothetical protein TsFJ059_009377 [Trichoderma semiorbis]|uniref:LysM domain-containing protein n=1 Tax=Trichoderma semiorbis TaxID=1491008 RepID=A0A9P8HQT4_9HYPO|nr:hypothetical protein TsFJ059_009377 [Trichoderma semiorbis]
MKLFNLVSAFLAFRLTNAYLVTPPGTPAPGADSGCSEWVQQSYGLTCAIIEQFFGMSAAQFEAWNPSVTLLGSGCNLIEGLYYCVQVNYVSMSFLSTGPPTTTTKSSTASTTSSGNGITTPTPTQSGLVSNCNKFYKVVSGNICVNIATANGISLDNFYAWNPAVGTSCTGLWPDYYVCVGVLGSGPSSTTHASSTTTRVSTTTTSGNGIITPTPTQSGMVSNCDAFYKVVSGDGCADIATAYGISLNNFYAWNPAVGTTCAGLWPDYYVCVGIKGSTTTKASTTTKVTPSTTTKGNGVATPTPTQANMTTNCKTFYLVKSGDDCFDIAAAANVTLANFYAWNPAIGTSCSALWPDYYVCVGIL